MEQVKNQWDKRIQKAEKFFEKSLSHGRKVYDRYQDNRDDLSTQGLKRVNLFYANVNTIKESLFNSMPKPDVRKLQNGNYTDDVSRVAALIMQRCLNYELQCSEWFESSVKYAILDRLVPGIGQVWVRFDMLTDVMGEQTEAIFVDHVFWEDFIYEPARSWSQVGWVGRRLDLSKDEVLERWGEQGLAQCASPDKLDTITPKEVNSGKYEVYEIWDKKSKTVFHVATGSDFVLDSRDDPYGLPGFFPCPCPLVANVNTAAFLPVTDYHIAQDQYIQLDVLYARISLIIEAVKVAGVYDSAEEGTIGRMLQGQENKLVPIDNWAMYAEKGGAKGVIDWYPVEQVVGVLASLQEQFSAIKELLGEISGMADIVRGDSNQYETAKAQQIKAQFASVRMNGYQRDVAHFVRDIMRIMAGLICNLYSDQKIMSIAGTFSEADQEFIPQASPMLRNQFLRMYNVDIESDSLTQADWALEKDQRMEVVGAVGQLLSQSLPIVTEVPELGPMLLSMVKFAVTGFKGANEIEGIINAQLEQMIQGLAADNEAPDEPSDEEKKMQMQMQLEQQKLQGKAELEANKLQAEMALEATRLEAETLMKQKDAEQTAVLQQQKLDSQIEIEKAQMEADLVIKNAEAEHKERMYAIDMQIKMLELEMKQQESQMKIEAQREMASMKMQQSYVQGEQKLAQAEKAHEMKEKENGQSKTSPKK